jgi:hypothetical protein
MSIEVYLDLAMYPMKVEVSGKPYKAFERDNE